MRLVEALRRSLVCLALPLSAACSQATAQPTPEPIPSESDAAPTTLDGGVAESGSDTGGPDAGPGIAPMLGSRTLYTLTATPTGLVAIGGLSSAVVDAVDVYDRAKNRWRAAGEDTVSRYGHAAAAAADGKIYVVGGTREGTIPLASASLVDPAREASEALPDLPEPRLGLGLASAGDKLFAFGGKGPNGASDAVFVYDLKARAWSRGPVMPSPRLAFATVAVGSRVYLVGGRDRDDVPLSSVVSFDTATETFRDEPSLSEARYWLCAAATSDGAIVAIGGVSARGFSTTIDVLQDVEVRKVGALPEPRGWHGCARGDDGRIYIAGGAVQRTGSPTPTADMMAFDPKTSRISTSP